MNKLIPSEENDATGDRVRMPPKGKKLNYTRSINPSKLKNYRYSDIFRCRSSTMMMSAKGRFIA